MITTWASPPNPSWERVQYDRVHNSDGYEKFEEMCFTTVVTCGPPAPHPVDATQSWRDFPPEAITARHEWLCAVENHIRARYQINDMYLASAFIGAFHVWWRIQQENASD